MIQQSINQLLTTAGMALRLSPLYEKREAIEKSKREASELGGRAKAAATGLSATAEKFSTKEKLTESQLQDIEKRVPELNKVIYDAKIRAKEGDPLSQYIDTEGLPSSKELAGQLKKIEKGIERKRKQTWQSKAERKLETKNNVETFRNSIILGADERPLQVKEN